MQEPHDQGVADQIGPAPCVGARESTGEASEEGRHGLGIEPRKQYFETPTLWVNGEGNMGRGAMASPALVSRGHRPPARVDARRAAGALRHDAREPGDLHLDRLATAAGPHRGGR